MRDWQRGNFTGGVYQGYPYRPTHTETYQLLRKQQEHERLDQKRWDAQHKADLESSNQYVPEAITFNPDQPPLVEVLSVQNIHQPSTTLKPY